MATIIKMPKLGLTMEEGVIIKWQKKEGEHVKKGEVLADIESDKSVGYYESPEEGYVIKLIAEEGDTVECQKPIAVIGKKGETYESTPYKDEGKDETKVELEQEDAVEISKQTLSKNETNFDKRIFASPAAKKLAKENNIELSCIQIRADKKRIESQDVADYIEANKVKATPLAKKIANELKIDVRELNKKDGRIYSQDILSMSNREDKIIPVKGVRKAVAKRLKESLETAAHITLSMEVDMTEAMLFRRKIKDAVFSKYGVKISINDIVTKCVAQALVEFPRMNCQFTGDKIIEKGNINIGMAVALDEGLIAPVVKNVDKLTLWDLAKESQELANKARTTGLATDDITGGTFSISNMGMFNVIRCTSIINQPESAILSVGIVKKMPVVVEDNKIEIRSIMDLTINYDHRPIDGSLAAKFLQRINDLLQEPWILVF